MGASISKVSCSDISIHHKKHPKPFRRPHVKIDKTKIGIPTDFRHTYHVGNDSPIMEEFTDNASIKKSASLASDTDFMATMAQIADALQKLPLHSSSAYYTPRVSPKRLGNSVSDQQIIPRRTFSLLGAQDSIEASTSMIIQSTKNEDFIKSDEQLIQHLDTMGDSSPSLSPSESMSDIGDDGSDFSPPEPVKLKFINITDSTSGFSSRLQSKIDAQIVELARARSKHVKATTPRSDLMLDKPALMI